MKKLLLVIMFLIPCSICSFWFKRKATFFIDKNTSKNTKIVYLKDRNLYLDINDYVFGVVAAEMPAFIPLQICVSADRCTRQCRLPSA